MSDARPVFLLVDDDATTLAALAEVLEGRYGRDYRVLAETSAAAGLRRLEGLREEGAEVALLVADLWMPEMDGVELLTRAGDLHPGARRALIIDALDTAAFGPIQQGMALGRIDLHLHKPWDPADDLLHPLVTELLAEWTRAHRPPAEMVRVVGERWDARSHELRDLLDRNSIPTRFYEAGTEAADAVLRELGAAGDRLPVVAVHGGPTFVGPSNVELAGAFGVKTRADPELCDLAVVGAGPAGLAAAVYGASEGLRTVVVEREAMGGQAGTSSMIRNYLGFPRGVSGTDLAQRAYSQAFHFGAEFIFARAATALRVAGDERLVALSGGSEIRARAVVLATGVTYRRLGVPSIDRLLGAGVFYGAAATEARAMEGQHVYVVGAANSAGQAAIHLARWARRVTLLVRRDALSATMSAYLVREIERTENIDVRPSTEVVEGRGEQRLEGLVLKDARTGETEDVPAVALFILIGAAPHTAWLEGVVARDDRGFILTGPDLPRNGGGGGGSVVSGAPGGSWPLERRPHLLETSVPGVFAVGDVRHRSVKRVASAVGEGSIAISFVHEYLQGP